jgi:hypothetical protein
MAGLVIDLRAPLGRELAINPMKNARIPIVLTAAVAAFLCSASAGTRAQSAAKMISPADCTGARLGSSIPVSAIGEPVSAVTLEAPRWVEGARGLPAYCMVNGSMAPVDRAPTAKPINFQVAFPATWSGRSVQLGGGGMNGKELFGYRQRPGASS